MIRDLTDAELEAISGGTRMCTYSFPSARVTYYSPCPPLHDDPLINAFLEGFEKGKQKPA